MKEKTKLTGKKKIIKIILIVIIVGFSLCVAGTVYALSINAYIKSSTRESILTPEQACLFEEADCIIVLGAGIYPDGSPSPMLEDRIRQGVELYKLGAAPKLIMSGDHGREEYDEVNSMKGYAMDDGVPSEDIFMDHAGFSTYETMYRARDIFLAERVIIVTQRYHLHRALFIAEKLGLEAVGVPSDPRTYVGQAYREIREVLARNKDFLFCTFKPSPTYLGETIPVWGDGNKTNDRLAAEANPLSSSGK